MKNFILNHGVNYSVIYHDCLPYLVFVVFLVFCVFFLLKIRKQRKEIELWKCECQGLNESLFSLKGKNESIKEDLCNVVLENKKLEEQLEKYNFPRGKNGKFIGKQKTN